MLKKAIVGTSIFLVVTAQAAPPVWEQIAKIGNRYTLEVDRANTTGKMGGRSHVFYREKFLSPIKIAETSETIDEVRYEIEFDCRDYSANHILGKDWYFQGRHARTFEYSKNYKLDVSNYKDISSMSIFGAACSLEENAPDLIFKNSGR